MDFTNFVSQKYIFVILKVKDLTMVKVTKEAALEYHNNGRPGKIEVKPTKPYSTQTDLSLAYSPGVAYPCLEIQQNPDDVYKYTDKR